MYHFSQLNAWELGRGLTCRRRERLPFHGHWLVAHLAAFMYGWCWWWKEVSHLLGAPQGGIALSGSSLIVQDSSPGFIIWEMAAASGRGLELHNVTVAAFPVQGPVSGGEGGTCVQERAGISGGPLRKQ